MFIYERHVYMNINNNNSLSLIGQIQERQNSALERLSTGKRINSAADGAAAANEVPQRLP